MSPKIICPVCSKNIQNSNICSKCGYEVECVCGIIDLRRDKTIDTLLDTEKYDQQHGVIPVNHSLANIYYDMMRRAGKTPTGDVLEIASGSGNLTIPLYSSGHFGSVCASDISLEFMKQLNKKVKLQKSDSRFHKFLFDANKFPFQEDQFDFVVGNSVLHHFANFENSLREAQRVLRTGGVAIFGEPIVDTHAFLSLAAGMIVRLVDSSTAYVVEPRAYKTLQIIQNRTSQKMCQLNSDRTGLDHIEDKFQFPINYLKNLTKELGYSDIIVRPPPDDIELGALVRGGLERTFRQMEIPTDFLDGFRFIFDALTEDYGNPLSDFVHPLFSFFAYVK